MQTKVKKQAQAAGEVKTHYDLNEVPQPLVQSFRAELGAQLEKARALEGQRRCRNAEVCLEDIEAQAEDLIQTLQQIVKASRAIRNAA